MLTQREWERLNSTKPVTVRFGTDGKAVLALVMRSEFYADPNRRDAWQGWVDLGFEGESFQGENGKTIIKRFNIERLVFIGDTLIILPSEYELTEIPIRQWLENERRQQIGHLRELAYDVSVTSLRGILEVGIDINCFDPHLSAALTKAGWRKVEWDSNKPGWHIHTVRSDFYVPESEVERVFGFKLPTKDSG